MRNDASRNFFHLQRSGIALGPVLMALLMAGCGGGGGGGAASPSAHQNDPPPTNPGGSSLAALPAPVDASIPMTMACVDGADYQCSGDAAIRTENGITLTRSGVQVYGRSSMDLTTTATGLTLASGGLAEVRIPKPYNHNGTPVADNITPITGFGLVLSQLGIQWDGATERPMIVETFGTTAGRTTLGASNMLTTVALPASSDLTFYNFAPPAGTQANYANNRYFPRADPSRCDPSTPPAQCPTIETAGLLLAASGDWRTGGSEPDKITASRLHEDGDVHAGNGRPDATGPGVPYPGSKGYREYEGRSFAYVNLGDWTTQDTVDMAEWHPGGTEHNTRRRGMVTFGDVTDPATIPTSGTATYTGNIYGTYSPNGDTTDPDSFIGTITLTVDFATRQIVVQVQNTTTNQATPAAVPLTFSTTVGMGAAGQSVANYLNGTVQASSFNGGIGGRFFGAAAGGGAPPELGGVFSLSNGTTKLVALGGFIAQKR